MIFELSLIFNHFLWCTVSFWRLILFSFSLFLYLFLALVKQALTVGYILAACIVLMSLCTCLFEKKPLIESCVPPFHANAGLQLILHGCGRVVGKATRQYIFPHVGPVCVVTFTGCRPAACCKWLSKEGYKCDENDSCGFHFSIILNLSEE